jgi:trimeric autotransporter adhesin
VKKIIAPTFVNDRVFAAEGMYQKRRSCFRGIRQCGLVAALIGAVIHSIASAQPANDPVENFIATDGYVYAMAQTNNVLYIGGMFSSVGLRTGSAVPISATTGLPLTNYPKVNGTISSIVGDGQGGWFMGGTFTRVGGLARSNLVHVLGNMSVDPNWQPNAVGGAVGVLLVSGSTLYIGGSFTNVNGQARNRLAALDKASGTLNSWNPNANGTIQAMAGNSTNIYIGGEFTSMGGQTRNRLAAVDATSGQPTTWNPNADDFVQAMAVSNGRLFVAGYFGVIGAQTRSCVASFDLGTGQLEAWNPNVQSSTIVQPTVFCLAVSGSTVYLGGGFSLVGGVTRVNVAAVDATTGLATSWDAHADYGFSSGIPLASIQGMGIFGNTLFVGGNLINIGGQPRKFAAALDLTTGNATTWNPDPNMYAMSFYGAGDTIYMGGVFSAVSSIARTNLAAFNLSSGQVLPWSPSVMTNVLALAIAGNNLYVGGEFYQVNGVTRSNLAAFDLSSGTLTSWNPSANVYVDALATWGNQLYAAGGFWTIGGVPRTNLAEFDISSGAMTSWDPALNRATVKALAVSGDTLYAGGLISTVAGQARRRMVAFDLPTHTLNSWDPGFPTGASSVEVIVPFEDRVYVGGRFNTVGGQNHTNLVAIDMETGQVLPWTANSDLPVYALAATTNLVFAGGDFTIIGGQKRRYLAAMDSATGQVTGWDPSPDFNMKTMRIFDGTLYTGGIFLRMGNQSGRGIAAFPLTIVQPPIIATGSLKRLGDGRFQFEMSSASSAVIVQGSADLAGWQDLQTLTMTNGSAQFSDPGALGQSKRFYRLVVP